MPILIDEPSTDICRRLWCDADRLVSSRLTHVEVAAALAMAERAQRVATAEHDRAWANFMGLWADLDVVEVTDEITAAAAPLARSHRLRGYDAVHCATAIALDAPDLAAATGDRQLLDAWHQCRLAIVSTAPS